MFIILSRRPIAGTSACDRRRHHYCYLNADATCITSPLAIHPAPTNHGSMLEEESAARVQKTQAELARPRRMSGLGGVMPPGQRRGSNHKENKWAMAINKQMGANKAVNAFGAAAAIRRMSFEKDDSQRLNIPGRKSSFMSQRRNSEESLEGADADGSDEYIDYQRYGKRARMIVARFSSSDTLVAQHCGWLKCSNDAFSALGHV